MMALGNAFFVSEPILTFFYGCYPYFVGRQEAEINRSQTAGFPCWGVHPTHTKGHFTR